MLHRVVANRGCGSGSVCFPSSYIHLLLSYLVLHVPSQRYPATPTLGSTSTPLFLLFRRHYQKSQKQGQTRSSTDSKIMQTKNDTSGEEKIVESFFAVRGEEEKRKKMRLCRRHRAFYGFNSKRQTHYRYLNKQQENRRHKCYLNCLILQT